jgi:BirA family biotin operon repressor/biotin-[acetyl-CoA-carboxylase] ligase
VLPSYFDIRLPAGQAGISNLMPSWHLLHFPELESTNTHLIQLAKTGAPEGTVVTTDFQTGGRGKPGREWVSPKGKNLLFSVLLRPPVSPAKAPMLTQISCRTVAAVLKKHGIESTLKKPNDVMVDGKKICGVLTEASSRENRVESVVVGIGLNINATQKELIPEATSMRILTGREFPRDQILQDFLEQFKTDLKSFYAKT